MAVISCRIRKADMCVIGALWRAERVGRRNLGVRRRMRLIRWDEPWLLEWELIEGSGAGLGDAGPNVQREVLHHLRQRCEHLLDDLLLDRPARSIVDGMRRQKSHPQHYAQQDKDE